MLYYWLVFFFTGCAAVGVVSTNNPKQKIIDAFWLFDEKKRPLRAESLIIQAISIYKENNNTRGLAEGYRAYGFFLRSDAVGRHHERYKNRGFLDKTITYNNRYTKSIEYFEKSAKIFTALEQYDDLTNIYLQKGYTYMYADLPSKACKEYKNSIITNQKFTKKNPNIKIGLDGYDAYQKYMEPRLKEAKCK